MRTTAKCLGALACSAGLLLGCLARAQDARSRGPSPSEFQAAPADHDHLTGGLAQLDDATVAGLPRGSAPEVLTWERVYALAVIRGRSPQADPGARLAPRLDPKALDDQSRRLGLADLARFRADFLGRRAATDRAARTFRDPAATYFEVLRRLHAVETAWSNAKLHEALLGTYTKLLQGEASSLSQVQVDQCGLAHQQAVRRLGEELTAYRDRLDELKVELGLSPDAPVVADRTSLGAFSETFQAARDWYKDSSRKFEDLPRLAAQLPDLDALPPELGAARPGVGAADEDPAQLARLVTAAERAAVRNRDPKESEVNLRLSVRRGVRKLLETARAYELERKKLVLLLRLKDNTFQRLVAPPGEGPSIAAVVTDLNTRETQLMECENRLVALWIAYQVGRLDLHRQLGTFPYNDWASFYAQLRPHRGNGGADPGHVQGIPQPATPPAAPAPRPKR